MKRNSVGIDIDIIREIAEVEGFNVEFVTSSWDSLIPMVNMGKADMTGGNVDYREAGGDGRFYRTVLVHRDGRPRPGR